MHPVPYCKDDEGNRHICRNKKDDAPCCKPQSLVPHMNGIGSTDLNQPDPCHSNPDAPYCDNSGSSEQTDGMRQRALPRPHLSRPRPIPDVDHNHAWDDLGSGPNVNNRPNRPATGLGGVFDDAFWAEQDYNEHNEDAGINNAPAGSGLLAGLGAMVTTVASACKDAAVYVVTHPYTPYAIAFGVAATASYFAYKWYTKKTE